MNSKFSAYFSSKKSIMKVAGFPTTVGSFSVDPHIAATIHPAPEKRWGGELFIRGAFSETMCRFVRKELDYLAILVNQSYVPLHRGL